MSTSGDYILGNSALHERVRLFTGILGKFVSSAPRALNIKQLQQHTGLPSRELTKLCGSLAKAGLLRSQPGHAATWALNGEPGKVTLEDVMHCVILEPAARGKTFKPFSESDIDGVSREVELLVMQATMSINQSVCQHLRKFTLDRLKFSDTATLPAQRTAARAASLDDAPAWSYPC